MYRKHWVLIVSLFAGVYACNKDAVDKAGIFTGFERPSNFPAPAYDLSGNPVTKEGFELGRKLFYDPVLSSNNTISCGSCHIQTSSFTHSGHSVSHGIFDRLGTRNSPPIMNLAWQTSFMWDGGVFGLDLQPIAPITNHVEMGETVDNILTKLRSRPVYLELFKKAYGTDEITGSKFLKSLSQFMVMCVSSHSKYDSVIRNQAQFTIPEAEGYGLFRLKCAHCHKEPLFTDNSFRNNGLGTGMANDAGRYMVTLQDSDKYRFKVPSLRNLDFTPPYMHDGRFFTLEAVLDHYTSQVRNTPNLDPFLQQNSNPGILIPGDEKIKIIAFLKTLNDRKFVTDKRFSEQ